MRAVKAQYFLFFAVIGSVLPYLSVFLARGRGLSDQEVGAITAMTGAAVMLGPVVLTLLADARLEQRTLLVGLYTAAVAALVGLGLARGFWSLLGAYLLFSLVTVAVQPLADGLNFAVQHQRQRRGLPRVGYHRVRVWGTVGFIVPSLALVVLIGSGRGVGGSGGGGGGPSALSGAGFWSGTGAAVGVAAVFAALGAVNALRLPPVRRRGSEAEPTEAAEPGGARKKRLPTVEAARALFAHRQVLVFVAAMWFLQMSIAAYYTFYPLYLVRRIHIPARWVGLIACVGVAIEIFFMLGFGRLLRRLGLKRLMVLGAAVGVGRMGLLWAWPIPAVAIGTQALHGIMVLVVHVAPPVYLNHRAEPGYRNSIQGLYTMAVPGTGRLLGPILAGAVVAGWSLTGVFAYGAALSLVAAGLFALGFAAERVAAG